MQMSMLVLFQKFAPVILRRIDFLAAVVAAAASADVLVVVTLIGLLTRCCYLH